MKSNIYRWSDVCDAPIVTFSLKQNRAIWLHNGVIDRFPSGDYTKNVMAEKYFKGNNSEK